MTDDVARARECADRLEWLSSVHGEHMNDGPRLTGFCHTGREAATLLRSLAQQVEERQRLVDTLTGQIDGLVSRALASEATLASVREALRKIAAFDDKDASSMLALTGSYGMFDEPGSVQIAREALSLLGEE
jgi:hypothetical protein